MAVEFRHPTWFDDGTYAVLRRHGAALCLTDRHNRRGPMVRTADWTYVRLHEGIASPRPCYGTAALRSWAGALAATGVDEAWVFFNNDPRGCAPANARTFARMAAPAGLEPTRFPDAPHPGTPRAMTVHDPLGPQPDPVPAPMPGGPPEPGTPILPDPTPADPTDPGVIPPPEPAPA